MALIRRLHVPLRAPADVIPHLGKPHHWKEGRSAKSLVDQWWMANDIPLSVRKLLDGADEWRGAELIDAFVERQTSLDDGRPSHSQSDLFAIVAIGQRLAIVVVEAKVDEGFDKTVDEWLATGGAGKVARLDSLCMLLGLQPGGVGALRYQLFHRTASATLEARRFRASQAVVIVQSWCPKSSGMADFADFIAAFGLEFQGAGVLTPAYETGGVSLRLGWLSEAATINNSLPAVVNPSPPNGPPATS